MFENGIRNNYEAIAKDLPMDVKHCSSRCGVPLGVSENIDFLFRNIHFLYFDTMNVFGASQTYVV